jgi:hypothetical protein
MSDREWRLDVYEQGSRRDVTLSRSSGFMFRSDAVSLDLDHDGDLHVHADVDGDACDTDFSIPMAKVIEFFAAAGWTLVAPGARHAE